MLILKGHGALGYRPTRSIIGRGGDDSSDEDENEDESTPPRLGAPWTPAGRTPAARHALAATGPATLFVERTIEVVRRVMVDAPHPAVHLAVPLQVDAKAAHNLDEAH